MKRLMAVVKFRFENTRLGAAHAAAAHFISLYPERNLGRMEHAWMTAFIFCKWGPATLAVETIPAPALN